MCLSYNTALNICQTAWMGTVELKTNAWFGKCQRGVTWPHIIVDKVNRGFKSWPLWRLLLVFLINIFFSSFSLFINWGFKLYSLWEWQKTIKRPNIEALSQNILAASPAGVPPSCSHGSLYHWGLCSSKGSSAGHGMYLHMGKAGGQTRRSMHVMHDNIQLRPLVLFMYG